MDIKKHIFLCQHTHEQDQVMLTEFRLRNFLFATGILVGMIALLEVIF